MPVDFQAEGLLDDLHDPRERAERAALLHHLLYRGVPLDDLRHAAAEGRLVVLAVDERGPLAGRTTGLDLTDGTMLRGRLRELTPNGVRMVDGFGPRLVPLWLVGGYRVEPPERSSGLQVR